MRHLAAAITAAAALSLSGNGYSRSKGVAPMPAPVHPTSSPTPSHSLIVTSRKLPTVDPESPVSMGEQNLVAANTGFGLRLFAQLCTKAEGRNVFFSPLSVSEALALTYNGAAGTTHSAMAQTLGLRSIPLDAVNTASASLLGRLQDPDPSVQLNIANALWADKRYPLSHSFLEQDQRFYGAAIGAVDFSNPASVDTINSWVKQQTNGKIPKILNASEVNHATRVVLANAVYFKGPWTTPFQVGATHNGPFTLSDGAKKEVPLMEHTGTYEYLETPTFQAISLPYGRGRIRMLVFLPKDANKLDRFLTSLTSQRLEAWSADLHMQRVDLKLPRFKVNYSADLIPPLSTLGMGVAFDPNAADFNWMGLKLLFISFVKHVALISVDEQGTEAAAATVIGWVAMSAFPTNPPPPKIMTVDHPFFCAIQDSHTGAILFMGAVVNPM